MPQLTASKNISILPALDVGITPPQPFSFIISNFFSKSGPRTADQKILAGYVKKCITSLTPRDAELVGLR